MGKTGLTVLVEEAIKTNDVKVLDEGLLESFDLSSAGGARALDLALKAKSWDALRLLLKAGADPTFYASLDGPAVLRAIQAYDSLEGLRIMLEAGLDPSGDVRGEPYICAALYGGCFEALTLLLQWGADPNFVIPNSHPTILTVLLTLGHWEEALALYAMAPYVHERDSRFLRRGLARHPEKSRAYERWAQIFEELESDAPHLRSVPCITSIRSAMSQSAALRPRPAS